MDLDSKYFGTENDPKEEKNKRVDQIKDLLTSISSWSRDASYINELAEKVTLELETSEITKLFDDALEAKKISKTQHDELGALLEGRDAYGLSGIHFGDELPLNSERAGEGSLNLDNVAISPAGGVADFDLSQFSAEAGIKTVEGSERKSESDDENKETEDRQKRYKEWLGAHNEPIKRNIPTESVTPKVTEEEDRARRYKEWKDAWSKEPKLNKQTSPKSPEMKEQYAFVGSDAKEYVRQLALKHEPNTEVHQKLALLAFDLDGVNSLDEFEIVISQISRPEDLSDAECDEIIRLAQSGEKLVPKSENVEDSKKADREFEERAFAAQKAGDFYNAQRNILKIKDQEFQSTVLGDMAKIYTDENRFDKARTLADLVKEEEYRERLFKTIELAEADSVKNSKIEVKEVKDESTKEKLSSETLKINNQEFKVSDEIAFTNDKGDKYDGHVEKIETVAKGERIVLVLGKDGLTYTVKVLVKDFISGKFKLENKNLSAASAETTPQDQASELPKNEETINELDSNLEKARSDYAEQIIDWKNKNREKKNWFSKTVADLGFEKQMPQTAKPIELLTAEKAYIEAKRLKSLGLLKKPVLQPGSNAVESGTNKEALIEMVEKEFDLFQKKITEAIPPLEKGRIAKGLEKWSKMPKAARLAITAGTFFVGGLAIGGMTLTGAAAYGGYRAVRSGAGMVGAVATGKGVDYLQNKSNQKSKEEIFDKYTKGINESNFAEREKALMEAFEKEQNKKNRQRIYKAGAMVAAGAGVNLAAGSFDTWRNSTNGVSSSGSPESAQVAGSPVGRTGLAERSSSVGMKTPPVVDSVQQNAGVSVNNEFVGPKIPENSAPESALDEGVVEQSPDQVEFETEMGDGNLGEVANVDATKNAATDLGNSTTAYGEYAGPAAEKFVADAEYHKVIPVNTDLSSKVVIETPHTVGVSAVEPEIDQNIVNPTSPESVDYSDVPQKLNVKSSGELLASDGGLEPQVEQVEYKTELGDGDNAVSNNIVPKPSIGSEGLGPSIKESGDLLFQGQKIAHEGTFEGHTISVLEDKFMEGAENSQIRTAFNADFAKSLDKTEVFGGNHKAIPFERDSMIDISNKVPGKENEIGVFLNGKKIAVGEMTENGPSLKLLTSDPSVKNHGLMGWLMPDTVYERAFKVAKKVVEKELTKFYIK